MVDVSMADSVKYAVNLLNMCVCVCVCVLYCGGHHDSDLMTILVMASQAETFILHIIICQDII